MAPHGVRAQEDSPWCSFVLSCETGAAAEPPGEEQVDAMLDRAFSLHMANMCRKPTLDVDLVAHCNLNCVSCCHFSPIARPSFLALDAFAHDLAQLAKLEGVEDFFDAICLMGGDPLLHPELASFVLKARSMLPRMTIRLVTNGLLLEEAPSELWKALRDTHAELLITPYPVDVDYQRAARLAADRGIDTVLGGGLAQADGGSFFLSTPLDQAGDHSPTESFVACPLAGSTMQLRDGRIYACNKGALLDRLNERFGTGFQREPGDYLELASITSASEIDSFRRTPKPMCRYCAQRLTRRVAWKPSKADAEEWIVTS